MPRGVGARTDEWSGLIDLIERVMRDEDLLPQVVAGVRSMVAEVASLPVADIAGHTRALLMAATRALAARRGPTEAELAFVEELAVTRATQGIPIEVVLGAIHVAERAIWARAREIAEAEDVGAGQLLDARELYDDWAEAVRSRLIRAHRDARAEQTAVRRDRDVEVMRRLLEGGSAATLAAAEAGLPYAGGLWVLVARHGDPRATEALRLLRSDRAVSLSASLGDTVVAVVSSRPSARRDAGGDVVVGVAGPVGAEEVGTAHRLAVAAVPAAEAIGRTGPVHVSEVASVVAVLSRTDLTAALLTQHLAAWRELGPSAEPVALAVRAWLEADRDTAAAAEVLFVHANTVRNRVQRFTHVTGIDPLGTFGAMDAWWLCRAWLADAE
ncbi:MULTISPECIES: PucR family transcriptional regulator [Mumia]|uniref:PucR family transcriptional regulator n=1 Tax=Mumia TaxID=1546255 RepID=UPI00141EEBBE|nr:helix-turn-helix domain-containing protein [Mumia sp. ZJ1417]QMW68053.1 helix-turn-helix domain-containing protein [Mumia sp. ZJ1417]